MLPNSPAPPRPRADRAPHPAADPPAPWPGPTLRGGEDTATRRTRQAAAAVPFTQVPTVVLRAAHLPAGSRVLYGLLCSYRRQDPTCRPRQTQLAQHLGPTTRVRTVQRLLQPLRAAQWITAQRVGARHHYTCDVPLRPGGFVQIPTAILRAAHLSTGARLLYGILLSYRGRSGIYPGQTRLAADLGVTGTRTVRRYLTELSAAGYLTWIRAGRGRTNRYHLHIPCGADRAERTGPSPRPAPPARRRAERQPAPGAPLATRRSTQQATELSAELDASKPDPITSDDSNAPARLGSARRSDPVRQQLRAYVADLARELGDDVPLASSLSRAQNLFRQSGLELAAFLAVFQEARRVTQRRTARIRKQRVTGGASTTKNKMPYFFAVLADRLAAGPRPTASQPAPGPRARSRHQRGGQPPTPAARQGRGGPPESARPAVGTSAQYSPLIAGAVLDLAQTFHDDLGGPCAVVEALQLWQQSAGPEGVFVAAIRAAARNQRSLQGVLQRLAAQLPAPANTRAG